MFRKYYNAKFAENISRMIESVDHELGRCVKRVDFNTTFYYNDSCSPHHIVFKLLEEYTNNFQIDISHNDLQLLINRRVFYGEGSMHSETESDMIASTVSGFPCFFVWQQVGGNIYERITFQIVVRETKGCNCQINSGYALYYE